MNHKHVVEYTRNHVDGFLKGMTTTGRISYPDAEMAAQAARGLMRYTPERPCKAIGGSRFWVSEARVINDT